jgi:hypothetical protein
VEDWEQFFVEKSRRRFEKERLEQRRRQTGTLIATAVIVLAMVVAILTLLNFR